MADIAVYVRDMLFASKIREAAKALGRSVQSAIDPAAFSRAAAGARLAIVDLRLAGALDALAALAADPALASIPSVGFVDHESTDVMEAARAAGCARVLTKGQFARELPDLLAA